MTDQWAFTAPFEGIVPHLYLDTRGNPTCGVGFLVTGNVELSRMPWSPDVQAAQADLQLVLEEPPGLPAHRYARLCKARLSELAMRTIFDRKVAEMRRAMTREWHLSTLPESVQLALVDMAYNMGAYALSKFAKLRAACVARDWRAAAAECSRKGVQDARNDATRGLFLAAVD